jgi:hypothetical protein
MKPCFLVLTLLPAAQAFAAEPHAAKRLHALAKAVPGPAGSYKPRNFKVSFKLKAGALEDASNFLVQEGSQANFTHGGEKPFELENKLGKTVEWKKHVTLVNCVVSDAPGVGVVAAACQFELSGPLPPETSLKANPISTFQLQTTFAAKLGEPLVIVDEPARHVEVTIQAL